MDASFYPWEICWKPGPISLLTSFSKNPEVCPTALECHWQNQSRVFLGLWIERLLEATSHAESLPYSSQGQSPSKEAPSALCSNQLDLNSACIELHNMHGSHKEILIACDLLCLCPLFHTTLSRFLCFADHSQIPSNVFTMIFFNKMHNYSLLCVLSEVVVSKSLTECPSTWVVGDGRHSQVNTEEHLSPCSVSWSHSYSYL